MFYLLHGNKTNFVKLCDTSSPNKKTSLVWAQESRIPQAFFPQDLLTGCLLAKRQLNADIHFNTLRFSSEGESAEMVLFVMAQQLFIPEVKAI